MRITFVHLKNYKSYAEARVRFRSGTNAIIGPNGAGKSSVLEAIGFALFNYRPDSLASCLREGTESGSVSVGFVSSLDEREYEVERSFNARSTTRYRIIDMDLGGVVLAEGSEEVLGWLREHLRVSPTAALDSLFENAVGVPQGTCTAPFQQSASSRKGVFDPLLQVEEYAQASEKLLDAQRHISDRLQKLGEEIARAEGLVARLPTLEEEQQELERALKNLEQAIAQTRRQLAAAQENLARLDAAERRLQEASLRVERAEATASTQERLLQQAEQALREAEEAAARVQATREGYNAYLEAEKHLSALEAERAKRDALREEQRKAEAALATATERERSLAAALAELEVAEQALKDLEPLVLKQEQLEASLKEAEEDLRRLQSTQELEARAAEELERTQRQLAQAKEGMEQAALLQGRLDSLRLELQTLETGGRADGERRAAAQADLNRLQEQLRVLSSSTVRCPICGAALTRDHRERLLSEYAEQTQQLEAAIADLDRKLEEQRAKYRQRTAEVQQAEAALRALPTQTHVRDLEEELARRQEAWQKARTKMKALAGAPQRADGLRAQLQALGNPRRDQQRYQDQVGQRERLLKEQRQAAAALSHATARMEQLDDALRAFGGLDQEISSAQQKRSLYQEDHAVYLANIQAASQRQARVQQVDAIKLALAEALAELAEAQNYHRAAEADYDPRAHEAARTEVASLEAAIAGAEAQHRERAGRKETVERELNQLRDVQRMLVASQTEKELQTRLLEILQTIREILRKAGPYVTKHLVRQISLEASRIYGDIMNDYTGQLHWSEDYDLTLEVRGHVRSFRQLSGGEQMSAALAVRLAALREISSVDVALFDEPTAHLDPDRRDSLADSILQVKGFSQLFVISHDDTFERAAQNYVHIVRDERGSHPEDSGAP